jgi:hypothetical protein
VVVVSLLAVKWAAQVVAAVQLRYLDMEMLEVLVMAEAAALVRLVVTVEEMAAQEVMAQPHQLQVHQ